MNIKNQNGFTLVQAIFILVVLALLGTYMVSLSTVQQATTTQAVLQARAYQAARAGLEWGIAKVVNDKSCAEWLPAGSPNIGDFHVNVTCDSVDGYTEGNIDYNVYNLKAIATFADISSPDYVSRTLEVTIHDKP